MAIGQNSTSEGGFLAAAKHVPTQEQELIWGILPEACRAAYGVQGFSCVSIFRMCS